MEFLNAIKRLSKPNDPWKKFYKNGDGEIEITEETIYEQLLITALKYPDNYAYEYFGKKTTYKTFIEQIEICAKAFNKIGIKSKNVVTICMPNTPEAIICFYALNKIGAISNMIHPLSAEEEIKNYLINNHAKLLVMIDMTYDKIKNIIDQTNIKHAIVVSPNDSMSLLMNIGYKVTEGHKINKPTQSEQYIYWKTFYNSGKGDINLETKKMPHDTPAVILHSGGTTGNPKGIVLSNGNFTSLTTQAKVAFHEVNTEDSVLDIMPVFHGFGLGVSIHCPLCIGAKVILIPRFNAKEFDKLLNQTKPTVLFGVPTLYEALSNSNNVPNLNLAGIKYVISGGDYLSETLSKKINDYLHEHGCSARVAQGYGMTESLAATALAFDAANKEGSIGIPLPGNYFKIIDPETKKTLKPYQDGEICVNGPTVMLGYLDNPTETNDVLQIHDDGYLWLHTGDIGYMDEDGIFFYRQRLKRMIISSGYNVYPSYVENIINQHPAVLSCTVIGIPHPYKVEVPKAYIVLKNGYIGINVKNSIKKFCEKHLSKHSIPYEFEFRKSLPKTLIGKIDFKKLIDEEGEKRKK